MAVYKLEDQVAVGALWSFVWPTGPNDLRLIAIAQNFLTDDMARNVQRKQSKDL